MMVSVERLRKWADDAAHASLRETDCSMYAWFFEVESIANEIENELADRYMELPIGEDGRPVHVGDLMEHCGELEVKAVGDGTFCFAYETERDGRPFTEYNLVLAHGYSHAQEPTVEDVLADFAAEVENGGNDYMTAARYAERIREVR